MKYCLFFILYVVFIWLPINAMMHPENIKIELARWARTPLKDLEQEPQSNLKKAFIEWQFEKYSSLIYTANDLSIKTNGTIRITLDPELAKTDPNKILCKRCFQCTAQEIGGMIKSMNHAASKWESEQANAKIAKAKNVTNAP